MELGIHIFDITLAFQGDPNRLGQLLRIAETWNGPISASLLVLESDIPSADKAIQDSHVSRQYVDSFVPAHSLSPRCTCSRTLRVFGMGPCSVMIGPAGGAQTRTILRLLLRWSTGATRSPSFLSRLSRLRVGSFL